MGCQSVQIPKKNLSAPKGTPALFTSRIVRLVRELRVSASTSLLVHFLVLLTDVAAPAPIRKNGGGPTSSGAKCRVSPGKKANRLASKRAPNKAGFVCFPCFGLFTGAHAGRLFAPFSLGLRCAASHPCRKILAAVLGLAPGVITPAFFPSFLQQQSFRPIYPQ